VSDTISFARSVPIRPEVDVCVAGGGPAGVAAAVAAARQGARVFLAERHTCLGGMGTAGLVPAFMEFGDGVNFLAAGVGGEVLDRLHAAGGAPRYDPATGRGGCVNINAEVLKRVYDALLAEAGVDFSFQTALVAVEQQDARVTAVICAAKSGLFAVRAHTYVDATGDGDLCAWAGAPFEKGDAQGRMQPGTLCSHWSGVDWARVVRDGYGIEGDGRAMAAGIEAGIFTIPDRGLPGMWPVGANQGGGNIGHTFGVDGTDERSVTAALAWGRRLVVEYERYYKQLLPGFEGMTLEATGALLGLRESRRILGDYVLTLDDYQRRAVFDDEIGRYAYAIDVHASQPSRTPGDVNQSPFRVLRYKPGESYGIPYRCLRPRGLDNVLVAGRCVSVDRSVHGSIRVMPGCFITGQAAGTAAALCAHGNLATRALVAADLQRALLRLGAYLPNAPT
jgi:glycine/D-amino acid oxidase-like deaminating enzyme